MSDEENTNGPTLASLQVEIASLKVERTLLWKALHDVVNRVLALEKLRGNVTVNNNITIDRTLVAEEVRRAVHAEFPLHSLTSDEGVEVKHIS